MRCWSRCTNCSLNFMFLYALELPTRRRCPIRPGPAPRPYAIYKLHLRETAIHKQLRTRDIAAVVGCEKYYGLRDLIGCTKPAEWNCVGNHLQSLLTRSR